MEKFVFMVLQLIGGLAFFLFGMQIMSANLSKMAGGKLEHSLKKMTSNVFISVSLGAVITIAMQSSSAVTVMLVGLVNSGIMHFTQTISIIFGANIGTTLTAWILSLSGIESSNIFVAMLKPENFSPILALIGVIMIMMGKSDRKKSVGNILVGFAVLMYGMEFMSDAVSPLAEMEGFDRFIDKFNNPFFALLVATLFTAAIQSSAASVGILQALSLTGGITWGMAIPIVMGQNIGTCITSVISAIGTSANAKRVATVHVLVNFIGTVICMTVFLLVDSIFKPVIVDVAVKQTDIALIHTVFNLTITVLLLPFSKYLAIITEKLVKDSKEEESISEFEKTLYLDERIFRSPSVAVRECNSLSKKMSRLAEENMLNSISLFDKFDAKTVDAIIKAEEQLDMYEDKLSTYLVKLSEQAVSGEESRLISKMLHTIGDFERLGDHALNLTDSAKELEEKGIVFSDMATAELNVLGSAIKEILAITTEAYTKNDVDKAKQVEPLEQVIDGLTQKIKTNHITRLQNGECTIVPGFILSDILGNYERISDHCSNIAVAVIEAEKDTFDAHKYLNEIKYSDNDFNSSYKEYAAKYTL